MLRARGTHLAAGVVGVGLLAGVALGQGIIEPIFETGFEADGDPAYVLGDLNGQNGWMVSPGLATAMVQDQVVRSGFQALGLTDGDSIARAQQAIERDDFGPVLMTMFEMYASTEWATIPDGVLGRFAAHQRLVFDEGGENAYPIWAMEYGVITTSVEYADLQPGDVAYYIELRHGGKIDAAAYKIVDPIDAFDSWHHFELIFDQALEAAWKGRALLYVDGEQVATINLHHTLAWLDRMQLENQRPGSSLDDNATLYFDDLDLGPMGCLADVNGDGSLDVLDFVYFQQLWVSQDPQGDCDASGEYDVLDFVCFSELFQAGCEF